MDTTSQEHLNSATEADLVLEEVADGKNKDVVLDTESMSSKNFVRAASVNAVPIDWYNLNESAQQSFGKGTNKSRPYLITKGMNPELLRRGALVVGKICFVSSEVLEAIPKMYRPHVSYLLFLLSYHCSIINFYFV